MAITPNSLTNPPGVKSLRQLQLVKEPTPRTAVRPLTCLWRGGGVFEDLRQVKFPSEDIGLLVDTDRNYVDKIIGRLSMDPVEATFEQIGYLLAAGVKNVTTGSADGGGSDYIYTYPIPYTVTNPAVRQAIQPYSILGGDDNEVESSTYCFLSKFVLDGKAESALMMSGDWEAKQVVSKTMTPTGAVTFDATAGNHINDPGNGFITAGYQVGDKVAVSGSASNNAVFTITNVAAGILTVTETITPETPGVAGAVTIREWFSTIAVPTVEEILFGNSTLSIDSVSASPGTTPVSNTLLSAKLDYTTGWVPVFTGSGIAFSFAKQAQKLSNLTLQIMFEHDQLARQEKANWRNKVARLIQVKWEGTSFATAGTTYSKKTLILNLPGKWQKFDKLGEKNGNDVSSGTFKVAYNSTYGSAGSIILANALSALP